MGRVEDRVRRVADEWVEVDAELGDGCGISSQPIKLRPGTADDTLRVTFEDGELGREVRIFDLRAAIDMAEQEAQR